MSSAGRNWGRNALKVVAENLGALDRTIEIISGTAQNTGNFISHRENDF